MADTKPTIVIVHGGWHVPEHYAKLITALEKQGYEVHCPSLLSTNQARPPNANLSTDSDIIRAYVSSLVRAGRQVVAIMHSYGGPVGTNAMIGLGLETRAAKGLPGGVSHLIYMAATVLAEGGTMMDQVRAAGHMHLVPLAFPTNEDGTCTNADPKTLLIGESDVPEAEVNEYVAKLVLWNGKVMYEPIEHAAWRKIPVGYIHTTADTTVPPDYQRVFIEMMEKAGRKVTEVQIATGHCPNLTATDEVVAAVNKILAA